MTAVAVGDTTETRVRLDVPLDEVDAHARAIMGRAARTFDLAAWFLPAGIRRDVRRLYFVLRSLDDLVDHADPRAAAAVDDVATWAAGGPTHGSLAAVLADLATRHPALPRDAVADFAAGMRADLAGPDHRTEADLARYCDQVAGTVGRMMAAVLGVRPGHEAEADDAARAMGRAMQRTNILRDLVEDAARGRVYLPSDAFQAAGMAPEDGELLLADLLAWPPETLAAFLGRQAARAEADYARGLAGTRHLRSGRRGVLAAGLMYREILRQIEREEHGGRRPRVVVPAWRKVVLVSRAVLLGH